MMKIMKMVNDVDVAVLLMNDDEGYMINGDNMTVMNDESSKS